MLRFVHEPTRCKTNLSCYCPSVGYRDDSVALASRHAILTREVQGLEQELARLRKEERELKRAAAKKRLRILLHRIGRWMRRHPKTTVFLALVLLAAGAIAVNNAIKAYHHRKLVANALGRCDTQLEVNASHRGARVFVDNIELGPVPQKVPICRGTYRLRLVHDRTLPWQRVIEVRQRSLSFDVPLVPWRPEQRPTGGILVLSTPPGAVLFANGTEAGLTPFFLERVPADPKKKILLGLWSEDSGSAWAGEVRRSPMIWPSLRPYAPPAEAAP